MKFMFPVIIIVLFFIFRKERFELDDTVRTISADRWADIIKSNHRYINQIDYYKDAPQINLERAIVNSPISGACASHGALTERLDPVTSDDINWEKLNDYEYSKMVGLLQGNYNRPKIKSINAG